MITNKLKSTLIIALVVIVVISETCAEENVLNRVKREESKKPAKKAEPTFLQKVWKGIKESWFEIVKDHHDPPYTGEPAPVSAEKATIGKAAMVHEKVPGTEIRNRVTNIGLSVAGNTG